MDLDYIKNNINFDYLINNDRPAYGIYNTLLTNEYNKILKMQESNEKTKLLSIINHIMLKMKQAQETYLSKLKHSNNT